MAVSDALGASPFVGVAASPVAAAATGAGSVAAPLPLGRWRQPVRRWLGWYVAVVLAADVVAAVVGALLAVHVRFADQVSSRYTLVTLLFPVAFVFAAAAARAYEPRYLGGGSEEFRRVVHALVYLVAGSVLVSYSLGFRLARGFVVLAFPVTLVLSLLGREVARTGLRAGRRRGRMLHRVVVAGARGPVGLLVQRLRDQPESGLCVVGVCVDEPAGVSRVAGVPVLGDTWSAAEVLREVGGDTLAVASSGGLGAVELRHLSWQLEGTGVDIVVAPSLTDVAGPRVHIRPVSGLPLLHVDEPDLTGVRRLVKRGLDVMVSVLLLITLAPLLVAIALAVRLTSSGPALFRQTRTGQGGRTFTMLKFRSMYDRAEDELAALRADNVHGSDGVLFKLPRDPRVTRVGRQLRRFSLDELPQLLNVLRGDMSLVGPRPPLPTEVELYDVAVRRRLLVRPGLTGLWQVSGRSDLSWEQSVRLDLYYVENWSLGLDVTILYRTVAAVLRSRGAY